MAKTKTINKKKKKYDYEAVAKQLNVMIEDFEKTEKDTVLEIWKQYQKAPNANDFFWCQNGTKRLRWSERTCYMKFKEWNNGQGLKLRQPKKSQGEARKEAFAEKKVVELVEDLQQQYPDPEGFDDFEEEDQEEKDEFIEKLKSQPAVKVVASDDYRKYTITNSDISKVFNITKLSFDINHRYKMKLVAELKRAIDYLQDILEEVEPEYEQS